MKSSKYNFNRNLYLKILITFCIFITFNIIIFSYVKNITLDFSKDKLYTLSENTIDILKGIKEPIKIQLFFF